MQRSRTAWGTALDAPIWSAEDIEAFLTEAFPAAMDFGAVIENIDVGSLTLRLPVDDRHLRPGGTISGPTQMTLADTAFYLVLLAHLGREALAVTTSLTFNFMKKPTAGAELIATARILKLGRRLAVGDVLIYSDGTPDPVAHAQVTYSRPG